MTREEIIRQLESPKEDVITHFSDDGDDEVFCSDVEAIEAVIAAFRQQQKQESNPLNEWISVKERLPLCGDRVIMTDGVFVCEAFLSISGKWMRNGIGWIESEITHWQPMPEPPKMEKTEK